MEEPRGGVRYGWACGRRAGVGLPRSDDPGRQAHDAGALSVRLDIVVAAGQEGEDGGGKGRGGGGTSIH